MQTRRELLDDVLDYVAHANDEGARTTMATILNRVLMRIWNFRAWSCLLEPVPYQFTTDTNTLVYPLPPQFGRIAGIDGQIRNLTTGRYLKPTTRTALEQYDPNIDTANEQAGQPQWYELPGTMPVTTQPSTAGDALEVVSDNAGDTTNVVEIEGTEIVGGVSMWTQKQVTLTGLAAVALGTWSQIDAFGKSYPDGITPATPMTTSVGVVSLQKAGGGAVLHRLQPHESAREVRTMRLYPKADTGYVISVPFTRNLQRVLRDAAPLPEHWDNAAFEGCVLAWRSQTGDAPAEPPAVWPQLTELSMLENSITAQQRRQRTPFR